MLYTFHSALHLQVCFVHPIFTFQELDLYWLKPAKNCVNYLVIYQVQNRAGEWIYATPIPGTFVCNIGDMLKVFSLLASLHVSLQIWLFHNIRPLYVILLGSGLDKWNISAHTSQSCQQFPSLPCICCVLLWGTRTLCLSHTSVHSELHINLVTVVLIFSPETNGAVKLWCCNRACWVLPRENRRCCQVRKGCVRRAFGSESIDELCHVNLLGADVRNKSVLQTAHYISSI